MTRQQRDVAGEWCKTSAGRLPARSFFRDPRAHPPPVQRVAMFFQVLTGQWSPPGSLCPRCRRNTRTSCRRAGRFSPWLI